MKIEFEKPKQIIHFAALDVGTVFKYQFDDTVYMKTECIDNDGVGINSIDLSTGEVDYFDDGAIVYPINAILYVKE